MSNRVRIRIMQRDGTCPAPNEPAADWSDLRAIPFPRGQNVQVSIVNDDGTETRLRNVKRCTLKARGRSEPVTCILELFNPIVDIEVPCEFVESDVTDGEYLGEMRTHLGDL